MSFDAHRPPDHRIVLLGASNVTISFRGITGLVRAGFGGDLDVFAAHGHGRSYGARSFIPGRSLPGITRSGLFDAVAAAEPPRRGTHVLLTDVGNDLIYGTEPDVVLGWVETALERLVASSPGVCEIVVTGLPLERMHALPEWHYRWFTKLLFPTCDVPTFAEMRDRAPAVDAGLAELARRFGAVRFVPPGTWYGRDPIHVLRSIRTEAWRRILRGWPSVDLPEGAAPRHVLPPTWWWHHRPWERRFLGFAQRTRQPIVRHPEFRLHVF